MKIEPTETTAVNTIKTDTSKDPNSTKKSEETKETRKNEGVSENSLVEVKIDDDKESADKNEERISQWKLQLQNLMSQLENLNQQEQTLYMNAADNTTLQNQLSNINNQRNTIYDNINSALINLSALDGSISNMPVSELMGRGDGDGAITGLGTTSDFKYRTNALGTGKATIENARQFDDKNASQMKQIMQKEGYLYHENAWCADFVGFAIGLTYGKENAPGDFFKTCPGYPSCGQLKNWAQNNGSWTKDVSTIQAGDLVIFDWNGDGKADHVGLYISNNGKTIHTIEGNTNGAAGKSCVEEKDRNPSAILGFIRLSGLE